MSRPVAQRRPTLPPTAPPARLRRIALRVERLGAFGRRDPEQQLVEQEAIVTALRAMAEELERPR
jgi:hypothetical protein